MNEKEQEAPKEECRSSSTAKSDRCQEGKEHRPTPTDGLVSRCQEGKERPKIENIHNFSFLIVDQKGEAVLVDTGFCPQYIPGLQSEYTKENTHYLEHALQKLGFSLSDIKILIQTHMHWDHTAEMSLFKNALIYAQANEFRSLFHLNPNEETYYCPNHWLALKDQFKLIDGNFEIKPGLEVALSGGHTAGHQVVLVQSKSAKIILGGDAPFNYDDLWKLIPEKYWLNFRVGYGERFYWNDSVLPELESWLYKNKIDKNLENITLSLKDLRKMGDKFITSHDPRLLNIGNIY